MAEGERKLRFNSSSRAQLFLQKQVSTRSGPLCAKGPGITLDTPLCGNAVCHGCPRCERRVVTRLSSVKGPSVTELSASRRSEIIASRGQVVNTTFVKANQALNKERKQTPFCHCNGRCSAKTCACSLAQIPCLPGCGCEAACDHCRNPSGQDVMDDAVVRKHWDEVLRPARMAAIKKGMAEKRRRQDDGGAKTKSLEEVVKEQDEDEDEDDDGDEDDDEDDATDDEKDKGDDDDDDDDEEDEEGDDDCTPPAKLQRTETGSVPKRMLLLRRCQSTAQNSNAGRRRAPPSEQQ